jgi:hypothetical protein
MNRTTDFMPKTTTRRPSRPRRGDGKTIGVHVPTKEDLNHLYRRMKDEYRSASEIMYLFLRADRLQYEAQQNQNNN